MKWVHCHQFKKNDDDENFLNEKFVNALSSVEANITYYNEYNVYQMIHIHRIIFIISQTHIFVGFSFLFFFCLSPEKINIIVSTEIQIDGMPRNGWINT